MDKGEDAKDRTAWSKRRQAAVGEKMLSSCSAGEWGLPLSCAFHRLWGHRGSSNGLKGDEFLQG